MADANVASLNKESSIFDSWLVMHCGSLSLRTCRKRLHCV